ncbi:unnamed protein product [Musa acuminata subsp. malaccensis]|uniref:DNA-directed RNA polymerase n=1 Tax=Musa acuminata subsp. malaccensis TaxID=214687 RepID=A0A804HNN5_MUSAM|nr:unnamed protein product [Musa acuminata subsp. malaccensis]
MKISCSLHTMLGDCFRKSSCKVDYPYRTSSGSTLPKIGKSSGKFLAKPVRTSLQVLTLKRETEKFFRSLSGDREQLFFPPNFVHSLDGSHMMMTAVACKRAGLNFAGVHDSYWTHACDVDQMN